MTYRQRIPAYEHDVLFFVKFENDATVERLWKNIFNEFDSLRSNWLSVFLDIFFMTSFIMLGSLAFLLRFVTDFISICREKQRHLPRNKQKLMEKRGGVSKKKIQISEYAGNSQKKKTMHRLEADTGELDKLHLNFCRLNIRCAHVANNKWWMPHYQRITTSVESQISQID